MTPDGNETARPGIALTIRLRWLDGEPLVEIDAGDGWFVDQELPGMLRGDLGDDRWSPRALVERLQAALMQVRAATDAQSPLTFGDLVIDVGALSVTVCGEEVHLTKLEFKLLYFFARNPDTVQSRAQVLRAVWGYASIDDSFISYADATIIKVHIGRLRRKIEHDPAHPRYILTVRGRGYSFHP